MREEIFKNCVGFDWDSGNKQKNWLKHAVSNLECEQCFFNIPFILADDIHHSGHENRFYALGQTNLHRFLFLVFTIRASRIRIISARDMSKKEREVYREQSKASSSEI